jgi:predicted aconitase with swiveling domain
VERLIRGKPLVAGAATGEVLVSNEPLSFWGGYDHRKGSIIDRRHPLNGQIVTGKILGIPFTRGSSTTTAVLVESVKAGTAPVAILCNRIDAFLSLAAIVAEEMYGKRVPIVCTMPEDFDALKTGQRVEIRPDGSILVADAGTTIKGDS